MEKIYRFFWWNFWGTNKPMFEASSEENFYVGLTICFWIILVVVIGFFSILLVNYKSENKWQWRGNDTKMNKVLIIYLFYVPVSVFYMFLLLNIYYLTFLIVGIVSFVFLGIYTPSLVWTVFELIDVHKENKDKIKELKKMYNNIKFQKDELTQRRTQRRPGFDLSPLDLS